MTEYIDKAVALSIHEPPKLNRHYQTDNLDDAYGQGWDDALRSIEHISAANVAPVVHARWIYDKKAQRPYCSVCKEYFYGVTNSPMSYCSNCGAKMDGGADHEND